MTTESANSLQNPRQRWWCEAEVAVLILLVLAAYFVRLNDVSMRGEEPRRAQVAFEILQRGDWLVPREQGAPFLSRPPLQNWLIAGSSLLFDSRSPWVTRLPSAIAMLLTTLMIYGYCRTRLTKVGALAAAAGFATLAELFTIGAQAETEMVFIALVSSSLILWHWGQMSGWPAIVTWIAGYSCMALAVLCKGPQPPVYFVGGVGLYLLVTRQLRLLFSLAHLVGLLVGCLIILAWLIPCAERESLPVVRGIVMSDTGMRFYDWEALKVLKHLGQYPLEIVGSTLPWSLLLIAYLQRDMRKSLGDARPIALFMGLCLFVAFPTCWIPPDSQTRYFTPLYPCLAILVGVVVDSYVRLPISRAARNLWQIWTTSLSCVMAIAGVAVLVGSIALKDHPKYGPWAEPTLFAAAFTAMAIVLAWLVFRRRNAQTPTQVRVAALSVAAFMILICTGLATNIRIRRSIDQESAVAKLKQELPRGHRMVSFGHIDALFAYYYAEAIEPLPWIVTSNDVPTDENVYFCFDAYVGYHPTLPFEWDLIATIPMDRFKWPPPDPPREVVIGRRR